MNSDYVLLLDLNKNRIVLRWEFLTKNIRSVFEHSLSEVDEGDQMFEGSKIGVCK